MKRVYDTPEPEDGARLLVDRVWPRGVRREALELTDWPRQITPSAALRKRWHAGELDYEGFAGAFRDELTERADDLIPLMRRAREGPLTLLSAVRRMERSHVPVLRAVLLEQLTTEDREAGDYETSSPPCYAEEFYGPDYKPPS
ncbi:DUF488 family protein [Methylonatrum kenyense]|uniref:DUF488 domain-containing protein n=1 Tax=Methylonatrum kenyense TaxID=455253 RepID=UPI0020C05C56|nr:DUF488 family protein [Methylonatrum kenyense]MCK8515846.1 DUF488 family protein [Methylonatrum kenyense]